MSSPGFGIPGRTTPLSAMSKAASISTPINFTCSTTKASFLIVRGPLNIARPVQGWPVIVQAGASDAGRQLAAETAEVIFGAGGPIEEARTFYADVKGRMDRLGRDRDHLKVLPGAFTIVGESIEQARAKRAKLDSLVHYESAIASLSVQLGVDASRFDPDGPLPEIPDTNASKSARCAHGRTGAARKR